MNNKNNLENAQNTASQPGLSRQVDAVLGAKANEKQPRNKAEELLYNLQDCICPYYEYLKFSDVIQILKTVIEIEKSKQIREKAKSISFSERITRSSIRSQ